MREILLFLTNCHTLPSQVKLAEFLLLIEDAFGKKIHRDHEHGISYNSTEYNNENSHNSKILVKDG